MRVFFGLLKVTLLLIVINLFFIVSVDSVHAFIANVPQCNVKAVTGGGVTANANTYYLTAGGFITLQYYSGNGHVRLYLADPTGAAITGPYASNSRSQNFNQTLLDFCDSPADRQSLCSGTIPFDVNALPAGRYIAYCDFSVYDDGPPDHFSYLCSGSPWCRAESIISSPKYTPNNSDTNNFCYNIGRHSCVNYNPPVNSPPGAMDNIWINAKPQIVTASTLCSGYTSQNTLTTTALGNLKFQTLTREDGASWPVTGQTVVDGSPGDNQTHTYVLHGITSYGVSLDSDPYQVQSASCLPRAIAPTIASSCSAGSWSATASWNLGPNNGGYIVDITNAPDEATAKINFSQNKFMNKGVGQNTSTTIDGFSSSYTGYSFPITAGGSYYIRVWNGYAESNLAGFTRTACQLLTTSLSSGYSCQADGNPVINLNWANAGDVKYYQIYRRDNSTGQEQVIANLNPNILAFSDVSYGADASYADRYIYAHNVRDYISYYYWVIAKPSDTSGSADAWSNASLVQSACTPGPNPPVVNGAGSAYCSANNTASATFNWSSLNAQGYYTYTWSNIRGFLGEGYTNATSWSPSGGNFESFYIRVAAWRDVSGVRLWSPYGESGWTTPLDCRPPTMNPPTNTTYCNAVNNAGITFSWNSTIAPTAQGYYTYTWSNLRGFLGQDYNSTAKWVGSGTNNEGYDLQVLAWRDVPGNRLWSAPIDTGWVYTPDCGPPPAPVLNAPVVSTNVACAQNPPFTPWVDLSWTSSAGAADYDVYRNGVIAYSPVAALTKTDSNLGRNQTYNYNVVACRLLLGNTIRACSPFSNTGTVVTPWCDILPPSKPPNPPFSVTGTTTTSLFAPGCYDTKKWGASQAITVSVSDNISGVQSPPGSVMIRLVKTTAPTATIDLPAHCLLGLGDCGVTDRATTSIWQTDPIPFSTVSPGNRYDEYELFFRAVDNGGPPPNDSGYQPQLPIVALPGVTDLNAYFYTQPSCAKPYLRTGQGSVHSNQGDINVPTPPP